MSWLRGNRSERVKQFSDGTSFHLGGFVVETLLPHTLTVSSSKGVDSHVDEELVEGTELVSRVGRRCGVVMGVESGTAVLLHDGVGRSHVVEPLERLRLPGYDPGGLHRLQFYEVGEADILLVTELAVSRIDAGGRIVWQKVYDDLTVHARHVDDEVIWLEGEDCRFGYELSSGHFTLPADA